tara:strand:+ start:483 stop:707 length:225 start_codon:yes stop_codon:yes gene_type:complete
METFTIHIIFNGEAGTATEEHDETTLIDAITRLTSGPVAQMGMIKEVKVVDMLDCTNFLWQKGKLVFPQPGVHC